MNNLKRVLSLALASVMLIGMMVTGASAFTDDADIENKEAVGTMTALNIIDGMPDGSFDPDGLLLREQAAKMVFVALNGGQKNDNLTTKEVGTFSDVKKGNWAEGYIEWCYNRGIIAGIGGGLFNPKGNLTGTQLAKIMLVAIGYNAKTEGLEGTSDWALNVNALALNKGFYKNLNGIDPEANITRDQAALLILNACNAEMVKYEYQITANNGQVSTVATAVDIKDAVLGAGSTTILTKSYDARTYEGVLTEYAYNKTDKTFSYDINIADTMTTSAVIFKSTQDFTAYLGQKVKVLYKADTTPATTSDNEVYGIADVTPLVVTTTVGESANATVSGAEAVKVNGTSYTLDNGTRAATTVYTTNATDPDTGKTTLDHATLVGLYAEPSTLKLVDVDGDGKIDWALVTPVTVQKVTYVSSTGITAGTGYTFKNDTIYDGVAKDDYVTIVDKAYNYEGKNVIAKATTVEGTVTRTRAVSGADTDLQIDGTWYSKAAATLAGSVVPVVGNDVTLVVVGSYYYFAKVNTTEVTDVLMVADYGSKELGSLTTAVVFPDGKSAKVTVVKTNGKTITAATLGTDIVKGDLYTYTVSSSGEYTLTPVDGTHKAGYKLYDGALTATDVDNGELTAGSKFRIADDAVVFFWSSTDNSVDVVTGKDVKAWGADPTVTGGQILGAEVNGFKTANVVAIKSSDATAPDEAGDASYGYVVSSKATLAKEGSKYYVAFQIWDGSKVVDVKENVQVGDVTVTSSTPTDTNQYKAGHFVAYNDMGDGVVSGTTDLTYGTEIGATSNLGFNEYAVTALDGKDIALAYTVGTDTDVVTAVRTGEVVYKLTTDTIIIGINSDDTAGVEGAAAAISATGKISGEYIKNVWALINKASGGTGTNNSAYDAGDKVIVLFVDYAK